MRVARGMSLLAPAPAASGARGDALEKLLGAIAISIRSQRRLQPDADETVTLGVEGLSLVYVLAGQVDARADAALVEPLATGDALLASRRLSLQVRAGTRVLVSHLELDDGSAHVAELLPHLAWIRGFVELEPAAAALAQHMGVGTPAVCNRDGDLVICRMMATTLLQSIIRAWFGICAPQGWPSLTGDAFLDRVVDAVNADPGRDWTVEQMASISALSRSVFAERFRAAYDRSPAQYVAEVRMRAARALLVDGRGVSEVSRELGYASDEGFSRAFRRHTGLTPSAWRSRAALASA